MRHLPKSPRIASSSGSPDAFLVSSASIYHCHSNAERGHASVSASNMARAAGIGAARARRARRSSAAESDGLARTCARNASSTSIELDALSGAASLAMLTAFPSSWSLPSASFAVTGSSATTGAASSVASFVGAAFASPSKRATRSALIPLVSSPAAVHRSRKFATVHRMREFLVSSPMVRDVLRTITPTAKTASNSSIHLI